MRPIRGACVATLLLLPWLAAGEAPSRAPPGTCPECHRAEQEAFQSSAMARAGRTPGFTRNWRAQGRPPGCLECHAPRGGAGLTCTACHSGPGHPFPPVAVPGTCARCHDAPGENTVRRFLDSPARRRGEDCLDCHTADPAVGFSHRFDGPNRRPGFLKDVAQLRLVLRREAVGNLTAVIAIRHRAGHALPGGTTGRSVWLRVAGLGDGGEVRWQRDFRFGWEHDPQRGWRDRTLPPGRPSLVEVADVTRSHSRRLRLELWYRYRPGPFGPADPRTRLLDRLERSLPVVGGRGGSN